MVSGANHSLALTQDNMIYSWGNCESGEIGRYLRTRDKTSQQMKIESIGTRSATDIFCNKYCSFYKDKKGNLYAFGKNTYGQLGIGTKNSTAKPTLIKELVGVDIIDLAGGEEHTIAVSSDGRVYCWGRNDEGQAGLGDIFGEYNREVKQEKLEAEALKQQEEAKEEQLRMSQPAPEDDGTVKKRKKPAAKKEKEVNLSGIMFFKRPQLVDTLPEGVKFNRVFAASHYCYCLSEETNELYSWGMGDDYVLGTRDDENVYVPQKVHPKMFYDCKIRHIGCGTSHLAVLTAATPESSSEQPPQFDFNLPLPVFEAPPVV